MGIWSYTVYKFMAQATAIATHTVYHESFEAEKFRGKQGFQMLAKKLSRTPTSPTVHNRVNYKLKAFV